MREYLSGSIDLWGKAREVLTSTALSDEERDRVTESLEQLSPSEAWLVAMRLWEQRTWADIAQLSGIPESTLQRYLNTALAKFKEHYERPVQ